MSYPNASWHSQQQPYYDLYASSSPAYNNNNDDSNTPLSPSSSTSSCSSDAPITPYYHVPPLPSTSLLYSGLDKYCQSPASAADYAAYEMYTEEEEEDPDATRTYHVAFQQCGGHESEYDHAAALRACDDAIAQLDASTSRSPYASYDAPLSPPSSCFSPHDNEYDYQYPAAAAVTCLPPSLLSCPPLLKLHQPQPRRSIPVISLAELAATSTSDPSARSPALSPLELQMPFPPQGTMSSYPSQYCTCTESYSHYRPTHCCIPSHFL
ncbi:hypothetical protein FB45DRAFT_328585 [Roridomyces roridus]|uniref:Uncharacterized protein n=1 Tax=Roridomyces roridus TaxID=1738132 RepID=A0AAD7B518_9AGAR|nr:hypothetical protein FB45DRAFT_328585 [Roridomyces roridus]